MRVNITKNHIQTLRVEIARTGIGLTALFSSSQRLPKYLSKNMVSSWLYWQTKSADLEHWDWVLAAYRALPDKCTAHVPLKVQRNEHTSATPSQRKRVRAEFERTGVGGQEIFDGMPTMPNGLTVARIKRATGFPNEKCPTEYIDAILSAYSKLPDNPNQQILETQSAAILKHRERTGLSWADVANLLAGEPDAPSRVTVSNWAHGITKNGPHHLISALLVRLSELPDGNAPPRRATKKKTKKLVIGSDEVAVTQVMYNMLWKLRRGSDINPVRLLNGQSDIPEGLTPAVINTWLYKKAKVAKRAHWEYVVALWGNSA